MSNSRSTSQHDQLAKDVISFLDEDLESVIDGLNEQNAPEAELSPDVRDGGNGRRHRRARFRKTPVDRPKPSRLPEIP